jgi:dimethylglycine dehydrogenase
MEHHYILTEDMPEVAEIVRSTGKEMIHVIDFGGEIYTRQERGGMLLGTTRSRHAVVAARDAVGFRPEPARARPGAHRPSLEIGFQHFPALQHTGIRKIVNGPFHLLARTATRWSVLCRAYGITGAPAPLWRASARAAASGWRSRTGW